MEADFFLRNEVLIVVNNEKKKITLSIPVETNNTLEEMARKHGMTKSGLVTFLINQLKEKRKRFYF